MFSIRIPRVLKTVGALPFISLLRRLCRFVLQPTLTLLERLPIHWVGISNASHINMTTLDGLTEPISDLSGHALNVVHQVIGSPSQNHQMVADIDSISIKPWGPQPLSILLIPPFKHPFFCFAASLLKA